MCLDPRKLKQYRQALGLTQQEAASKAGIPLRQLESWEQAERTNARVGSVAKLARALGVQIEDLLKKTE